MDSKSLMEYSRIRIEDAGRHVGEPVEIAGWLYNLRKSGKIVFPLLRDGTGTIQAVAVKANLDEPTFESLKGLTQESSLILRGKVRPEQRAPGGYEMDVEGAEIVQRIPESDPYPITPKEHGVDFLMDHRHLWLRSKRQHAAIRVRHEVIKAVRDYFDTHGFTLVDTPIFTPAACEGTSTLFEVNYFEDEKGVPDAIGPALQRSRRHGVRQGVLLRAHVSRREVEDAASSDRVLDGGAGDGVRHARRCEAGGRGVGGVRGRAGAGESPRGVERAGARHQQARKRDVAISTHELR